MPKKLLIVLTLVIFGGSVLAAGGPIVQKVRAQQPATQEQSVKEQPESATEKETVDVPGGHQDAAGVNVDHQSEGVE